MHRFNAMMKKLLRKQEGLAYLEFAITLPFLLALFLGAVEVTRYIIILEKVEKVSVTMSDLVAQQQKYYHYRIERSDSGVWPGDGPVFV